MEDSKMKPEEMAFWVKTDASCNNPDLGNLLGAYLCDALSPEKRAGFENHLDECIACWTDVTNWENLGLAAKDRPAQLARDPKKARSFRAGR
ncbi:MAG TPA: zf-HC2 domain-containing protein [Bryobacteraceae bacterium]|nr:zf-HC2 domain-containing protein [Bryobacteraceae bacterium]